MNSAILSTLVSPIDDATKEEIILICLQLILTFIFLITTIISVTLNYDFLLKKTDRTPLFKNEQSRNIDIYNRIIILAIVLILFFINIEFLKIKKYHQENTKRATIQVIVALITVVANILGLFAVISDQNNNLNFTDIENLGI